MNPGSLSGLRVALVHDWLTGMRGGEKVLEVFADLFPQAPIYTTVHVPRKVSGRIESHPIRTSLLQNIPLSGRMYRHYLPLLPWFVEQLKIEPVDLVLSTSSCVAKGVIAPAGAKHACYMFSPMRYVYDMFDEYFGPGRAGWMTRTAMQCVRKPLQRWDRRSAQRVDSLVAISRFIAQRIRTYYQRDASIIFPPVDTDRFARVRRKPEDYYLMVCALVPYKNVDLAIEAFRGLDRRLVIAGSGPMLARLQHDCPANVELRGWVDDDEIPDLVSGCRAFIFPNVEDFGIAPVEAMAAGRPVIALAAGGALDTVREIETQRSRRLEGNYGPTGVFFEEPTPQALADAVLRFEREESEFDSYQIQRWAHRFDTGRFRMEVIDWLQSVVGQRGLRRAG